MKVIHFHRAATTPVEAACAEITALIGAEIADRVGAGDVDDLPVLSSPLVEELRGAHPRAS
ncbi:MAG: hypothetical protein JW767_07510 [Thermoleophilia bacterium]|nr:hypothetical protein [Thermoleophilia bacterium]